MANVIRVFLSFAHQDKTFAEELAKQLSILRMQGLITGWFDGDIAPGQEWESVIHRQLNEAQIILLLISPAYLASDYCYSLEMKHAMDRHNAGQAVVIPIILRPAPWQHTPLGKLQALPKDARPVTKWRNQDLAFLDIARGIREVVESLQTQPSSSIQSPIPISPTSSDTARLEALEESLRRSYSYIRGYEDIIRVSSEPKAKLEAQQAIARQRVLANHFLADYRKLAGSLRTAIPAEILQIAAYIEEVGFQAAT